MNSTIQIVTGAYGYSGKYIAQRLLHAGHAVATLTNSLGRANPFGDRIRAMPLDFDRPDLLADHLRGRRCCTTPTGCDSTTAASRTPTPCATRRAVRGGPAGGRRRIVHVSITNPTEDSPLEYFRGKAGWKGR